MKQLSGTYGFFLGANSPAGFTSLYDGLFPAGDAAKEVYIIKGGPGTGKSFFMRTVASRLADAGLNVEYLYCSSDPSSLDGVRLPGRGIAILDGTAPHVCEPSYAGAVENYVNFSQNWDIDALQSRRDEIISLTDGYKKRFTDAYRSVAAARKLDDTIFDLALGSAELAKIRRRGKSQLRGLPCAAENGGIIKRFLTSISPEGLVCLDETIKTLCEHVICVDDSFGMAPFFLMPILDLLAKKGVAAYACYCPLNPAKLEHIIIPSLKLCYFTSNAAHSCPIKPERAVRIDSALSAQSLAPAMTRIKLMQRTKSELLKDAVSCLSAAKTMHDKLEACYVPCMDFAKNQLMADELSARLLRTATSRI